MNEKIIDLIYKEFNYLIINKKFIELDSWFFCDPVEYSIEEQISILTASIPVIDKLPNRSKFCKKLDLLYKGLLNTI